VAELDQIKEALKKIIKIRGVYYKTAPLRN
jgi:hypothetical protein